jgi:hypothetical protein
MLPAKGSILSNEILHSIDCRMGPMLGFPVINL